MANTKVNRVLMGPTTPGSTVVILEHIISDGSEESDLVLYDNSTLVNDPTKGKLMRVIASGSSCTCRLEFDQTTDSPIISFDPSVGIDLDFCDIGGISSPLATGYTGDITLTTANLDAGDEITIILVIKQ